MQYFASNGKSYILNEKVSFEVFHEDLEHKIDPPKIIQKGKHRKYYMFAENWKINVQKRIFAKLHIFTSSTLIEKLHAYQILEKWVPPWLLKGPRQLGRQEYVNSYSKSGM